MDSLDQQATHGMASAERHEATRMDSVSSSNHAVDRWLDRFPGEDMQAAFARAVVVPYSRLMGWVEAAGLRRQYSTWSEYRHDPVTEAMFVIRRDRGFPALVTVFRFSRRKR